MNLTELANKHKTDKGTSYSRGDGAHDYMSFYEYMLPTRDTEFTLAEIGIAEGASLVMWREYFPNAKICGLDIRPAAVPGCITVQGDQSDPVDLLKLPSADVIIDDGSHLFRDQLISLYTLFRHRLRPGGIYIIEDLHTAVNRGQMAHYLLNGLDLAQHPEIEQIMFGSHNKIVGIRRRK
jgi:hypothetical protein